MELRKSDFIAITLFALLCLTVASLTGCYSSITAREVTKDPNAPGLRYFLPSPYLIIRHLPNDTWDAELQVFVDRSHAFSVQPNASFAKSDFSLVNNADGTIKSFKLGQETTAVASATIIAANDIALKKMELQQQLLDKQIQAASKSSSGAPATGTGATGDGGTGAGKGGKAPAADGGTGAGAAGGAAAGDGGSTAAAGGGGGTAGKGGKTGKGNAAAAGDGGSTAAAGGGGGTAGKGGTGKGDAAAGDASTQPKEPENATSHLMVDFYKRQVVVYQIANGVLKQAGTVAEVYAPIAVNQYMSKSGGPVTAVQKGDISWFPPIRVELDEKQTGFVITLPTWSEGDKKFFAFYTDEEGKKPLTAEVADPLLTKFVFDPKAHVFSIKLEDLKNANVKAVRFNKPV